MKTKLYKEIVKINLAAKNCVNNNNEEWLTRHNEALDYIESQYLPHGSGIDSGCTINRDKTTTNKIVIDSSYHLMDDNGFYDGWLDFQVIVEPSLAFETDITIKGRFSDRNYKYEGHRDYLLEIFDHCLHQEIDHLELYR